MNLRGNAALLSLTLLGIATLGAACGDKTDVGEVLTLSPTALDFGTVPVDGREDLVLTVANDGSTTIDVLSASLETGDAGTWAIDWPGSTSLSPGDRIDITVGFAPEAEGEATGSLLVRTSMADPSRTVPLTGTGGPSEADADADGYSAADGDCDDSRADVHPGAEELCDGVDNDCSGSPEADETDADGDGWMVCEGDCDDGDRERRPGLTEVCDGKDNDCDGVIQDDMDDDGDGFSLCDGDCDDGDDRAWPGNTEVCDYVDNDCSGGVDDLDGDGDGFSACPSGGDCDDDDPDAHPVLVDISASPGGDGTVDAPFIAIGDAFDAMDGTCNTIMVRQGTYDAELSVSGGSLTLVGAEEDPTTVLIGAPDGARMVDASDGAVVTVQNLVLSGGSATADGGALRATAASLSLSDVQLLGNSSGGDGGAIAVASGSLSLSGCTFLDNVAADDGGAVAALSSSVDDQGSTYQGNSGARGGAVVWESCTGALASGRFVDNEAAYDGGAISIVGGSDLLIEDLELWTNAAAGAGGAVAISDLSDEASVLRNSQLVDNLAGDQGGGIAVLGSRSALVIHNNDLLGNDAGDAGGGLYLGADDASGTWAWSNLACYNVTDGIAAVEGSGASVAWNMAYNNTSGTDYVLGAGEDGGNNESTDPRLQDYDPADDPAVHDLSLRSDSPAIDSGPSLGGPSTISSWRDPDGSRNDRGLTGGPGARP